MPMPADSGFSPCDPVAAQARCFFDSMGLSPERRILAEMGLRESDPSIASCSWLLGGHHNLLSTVFLEPMERWGASTTFLPLRQHERALRLALAMEALGGRFAPVPLWPAKPAEAPPPRWHALLWLLLILQGPLSLPGSFVASHALYFSLGIPAWMLLALCASLPFVTAPIERWAFDLWPASNPAAWVAALRLAPSKPKLDDIAARANQCMIERGYPSSSPAPLTPPRFRPGSASGPSISIDFAALEALLADLRSQGLDPGVDAAAAALAIQESRELFDALPSQAPGLDRFPARNRQL